MTFVVTDKCVRCKFTDCVVVCPVDCFHEGPDMLVINPSTCIDCGVCERECPVGAIQPDTDEGMEKWVDINRQLSDRWPSITQKKDPPADADDWRDVDGKFEKFYPEFS